MVATGLTRQQANMLHFISEYWVTHGFSPSVREMAKGLKSGTSFVYTLTEALVDRGYITKIFNSPRTCRLTPEGVLWYQQFVRPKVA